MKKMKSMLGGVLAVAALLHISMAEEPAARPGPPWPSDRPGHEGRPDEGMLIKLLGDGDTIRALGLGEEQVKGLRDKAFTLQQAAIKMRADLEFAGLEQAKLLTQDAVNEEALMSLVEKTGRIRTELAKVQMRQILLLRTAFTPEQRARIHQFVAARRERFAGKGDGHPGDREKGRGRRERESNEGGSNRTPAAAATEAAPGGTAEPNR
jgi:Spy/CpxP family protein refolding chaperone